MIGIDLALRRENGDAMRLAITVWNNRISPVFDTAKELLLVDTGEEHFHTEATVAIEEDPFAVLFRLRQEKAVELLLCGALCRRGEERLRSAGLDVLPFLTGKIDALLHHLATGGDPGIFALPGCRRQCCRRRRQGAGFPKMDVALTLR